VTGQLTGTARWAGELAAGGPVLGVAADGAPVVQLAVMIAAATATSGAARFMHPLSATGVAWKRSRPIQGGLDAAVTERTAVVVGRPRRSRRA